MGTEDGLSDPKEDKEFSRLIFSFLRKLQSQSLYLEEECSTHVSNYTKTAIYNFLSKNIRDFDDSLEAVNIITGSKLPLYSKIFLKLRIFLQENISFSVRDRLRRNARIFAIYQYLGSLAGVVSSRQFDEDADSQTRNQTAQNAFFVHSLFFNLSEQQTAALARLLAVSDSGQKAQYFSDALSVSRRDKKICFLISALFPTTWAPSIAAAQKNGLECAWIGSSEVTSIPGYGVLETERLPTPHKFVLSFLSILHFMTLVDSQPMLLNVESFYGADWHAADALVLYTLLGAFTSAVRENRSSDANNMGYILYDALKPVSQGAGVGNALSDTYGQLMRNADKIVYNSNTEVMGSFVQGAYSVKCDRLHFYRHSCAPSAPKPRIPLSEGVHVVCITVCLGEISEPSRDKAPEFVRSIIEQGFHFHYYCDVDNPVVEAFKKSLSVTAQPRLHLHPINKSQGDLVNDLHQYHLGFNPADHLPFATGIASISDRKYQDGMTMFWQSTVGTSFLVYSAAGLPFVLPRGCVGASTLLQDSAIPLTFSELENLPSLLKDADWEALWAKADASSYKAHAETYSEELVAFLTN